MRYWIYLTEPLISMKFLPNIKVRTSVIFDKRGAQLPWEVAQGKFAAYLGLKDTIELNMHKIVRLERNDLVAEQMVKQWLLVKILIDTREDLEVRGIREHLPGTYEQLIFKTNLKVIYETAHLKRYYTNMAIENILNGEWIVDDTYGRAYADLGKLLRYWLDASTDIENLRDKVYLGSILRPKNGKASLNTGVQAAVTDQAILESLEEEAPGEIDEEEPEEPEEPAEEPEEPDQPAQETGEFDRREEL